MWRMLSSCWHLTCRTFSCTASHGSFEHMPRGEPRGASGATVAITPLVSGLVWQCMTTRCFLPSCKFSNLKEGLHMAVPRETVHVVGSQESKHSAFQSKRRWFMMAHTIRKLSTNL